MVSRAEMDSPIGPLALYGTLVGLMAIVFPRHSRLAVEAWVERVIGRAEVVDDGEVLEEPIGQLREYFDRRRTRFDLDLDIRGTCFQQRVWEAVTAVPYGQTRSYREIATAVGQPRAVRAVGAANGANPLPLVIPCHRIIGSNGSLHGYGGGLDVKAKLLELEQRSLSPSGGEGKGEGASLQPLIEVPSSSG